MKAQYMIWQALKVPAPNFFVEGPGALETIPFKSFDDAEQYANTVDPSDQEVFTYRRQIIGENFIQ